MPPQSQKHQTVEEDYLFDSEIIFVHDSNAHILKHNALAEKALAYTVPDAIEITWKATFASQPGLIYLHLITNDLESAKTTDIKRNSKCLIA